MTKSEKRRQIWATCGRVADNCQAMTAAIVEIIKLPDYAPDIRLLQGALKQLEAASDRLRVVKLRNTPSTR